MSESSNIDFFTKLDWTKSTEDLLISWADIALCYTWIFDKSYRHYNHVNYRFTIPVIVFSTITGTLYMSFGNLLNEDQAKTGQIIVGGVNIFIGILSTLQNFFRYAQQSEANLSATRDWAKLHRNIKIELSIERQNRKDASEFVRSLIYLCFEEGSLVYRFAMCVCRLKISKKVYKIFSTFIKLHYIIIIFTEKSLEKKVVF